MKLRPLTHSIKRFVFLTSGLILFGCQKPSGDDDLLKKLPESFTVKVTNPLSTSRTDVLVYISEKDIHASVPAFNPRAFVVRENGKIVASQYNLNDEDYRGIVAVLDSLPANGSSTLEVRFSSSGEYLQSYTKRTQAELSHKTGGEFVNREYVGGEFQNVSFLKVPPEHKDHSWFIRYEGPGWESDKVGYRFYLDQRNATDVFGKKTPDMILHQVGHDGFDSYHNMQPWGMDIMKVGESLGVGSIGAFYNDKAARVEKTDSVDCRITENGNVYSSIVTNYYGWQVGDQKVNVRSRLSIHAGTRLTRETLSLDGELDNLCTGIVKDPSAVRSMDMGGDDRWAYLATYGRQSLNQDELGLAVFFDPRDVSVFVEDKHSHIVVLRPKSGTVTYYFAAAWVLEPDGIKNEAEFTQFLQRTARELANPVVVNIETNQN